MTLSGKHIIYLDQNKWSDIMKTAERKWINIAKSINLDKSHNVILQKDLNYLMEL